MVRLCWLSSVLGGLFPVLGQISDVQQSPVFSDAGGQGAVALPGHLLYVIVHKICKIEISLTLPGASNMVVIGILNAV